MKPSFALPSLKLRRASKASAGKRVLAAGVFEVFHAGHYYFLSRARALGDELTVIVTSDPVAASEGKKPQFVAAQRARLIRRLNVADRIVVGRKDGDVVRTVKQCRPDIIALGFDQTFSANELKRTLAKHGWHGTIVRIGKLPDARDNR